MRHPEHGGLIVRDPAAPTRWQRLQLRILAIPYVRRTLAKTATLALLLLGLVVLLALAHLLTTMA